MPKKFQTLFHILVSGKNGEMALAVKSVLMLLTFNTRNEIPCHIYLSSGILSLFEVLCRLSTGCPYDDTSCFVSLAFSRQ